jgi:hypothetical protein
MDSKTLEEFYRRWLLVNQPETSEVQAQPQEPQRVESIDNIIFQNDIFELYIEKGNKII